VENWHGNLNKKMRFPHPNIGKFISSIQKEEELVRVAIIRGKNGIIEYKRCNDVKNSRPKIVLKSFGDFVGYGFFIALEELYQLKFE
jgi:hypothetical protein